jgi:nitrate reductase NapE component
LAKKTAPSRPAPARKPDEDSGPDFELVEDDGPDFEVVEDEETEFEVVEDDEPEPPRRKAEPRNDEALTSKPKTSRKAPTPVDKRRRDDQQDEDDRPAKGRRSRDNEEEDEEDERPAKQRDRHDDDEDDDELPAKRRRARDDAADDDDDERPARHRQARDDYDDGEEEDDDDEGDRPAKRSKLGKKKKSGSKLLLVLGIVLGGLLVIGLVGGGVGYWVWTKPVVPSSEWSEFSPEGGRFSVLMPGIPRTESPNQAGVEGKSFVLKRDKEEMEFAVAYVDVPAEEIAPRSFTDFCARVRDGYAKDHNAKTTQEKDITLDGHPGMEFQFDATSKSQAILRVYDGGGQSKRRWFFIGVDGKGVKPGRTEVAKIFESFKLK